MQALWDLPASWCKSRCRHNIRRWRLHARFPKGWCFVGAIAWSPQWCYRYRSYARPEGWSLSHLFCRFPFLPGLEAKYLYNCCLWQGLNAWCSDTVSGSALYWLWYHSCRQILPGSFPCFSGLLRLHFRESIPLHLYYCQAVKRHFGWPCRKVSEYSGLCCHLETDRRPILPARV